MKKNILIVAAALMLTGLAQASPVGLWKTIDDATKKEKSLVRISDNGGVLNGRIEKLLDPEAKADGVCDKCSDDRKGQPIVGLNIIRNVKANADDTSMWDGGEILDPNNGKVYRVRLKPVDGGKKLEVRGYIGAPLLGRTQVWHRVE
jgi:uncharacterized protein (DUF2147 family)